MRAMHVAMFSTYPPRVCGIGSFAFDLREELVEVDGIQDVRALAVVDESASRQPAEVLSTVREAVRGDYIEAARLVARDDVDVVSDPPKIPYSCCGSRPTRVVQRPDVGSSDRAGT